MQTGKTLCITVMLAAVFSRTASISEPPRLTARSSCNAQDSRSPRPIFKTQGRFTWRARYVPIAGTGLFTAAKSIEDVEKRLIGQWGPYQIYLVDGERVRNRSLKFQEFGESATHNLLPEVVPESEIWIEDIVHEDERPLVIAGVVQQLVGGDYNAAIRYERQLRRRSLDRLEESGSCQSVYVSQYRKIGEVAVWLVDGRVVRDRHKTDFTQGGHGYVYSWIPRDEIWLEYGLHETELPFILLHESLERELMKEQGMSYNDAHAMASNAEFRARHQTKTDTGSEQGPDSRLRCRDPK